MLINQGKKWTQDSLDKLKELCNSNKTIKEISQELYRTESAISAKIESLGLIPNTEAFSEDKMEYLNENINLLLKYFNTDYKTLFFNLNKIKLKMAQEAAAVAQIESAPTVIIESAPTDAIENAAAAPTIIEIPKLELAPMPQMPKEEPLIIKEPAKLTVKQEHAFELFKKGESMCITGPAGTGKSYLISNIREYCIKFNKIFEITALTGVAATLINGRTLHAWSGLGLIQKTAHVSAAIINSKPQLKRSWQTIQVLIIDEVSMMDIELFEKLNKIAKLVRENNAFFGGIQLILCGDFAQLGPIKSPDFIFQSKLWNKHIQKNVVYLDEIMRQDDPVFIKLLGEIRLGIITDETKEILNSRLISNNVESLNIDSDDINIIKPTKLYPHKVQVEDINLKNLKKLIDSNNEYNVYKSNDTTFERKSKLLRQSTEAEVQYINDRCPKIITLAVGAQVMLTYNMSFGSGLINGSRGVITHFKETMPYVLFDNGLSVRISPHAFKSETSTHIITRTQIPLILAWAITIHKCQGSTISCVITDLQDIFCDAQGYVTLSRVKSLEGLHLMNINYKKITCSPIVKKFYDCLANDIEFDNIVDSNIIYSDDDDFNECLL
jgi:ATP-dependent DNA helicase PIF1